MHIFLTGEIQIGRSMVIERTLEQLNVAYSLSWRCEYRLS